jgi:hypothetical protein
MAASLKDKRTPITTPPYQVPSVDITPVQTRLFSRWSLPLSERVWGANYDIRIFTAISGPPVLLFQKPNS